ncbi:unnamed protein product [Peronospora farinosa]|uniref:RxLR effector protein n=1 Tax=Peronospora farinosa TaxID=134698 RepID=A0AAV0UAG6_9STRA|nr:unnamed protein product [Peronospora farinosa]CAI5733378.1 unnamed protein product [Peronospora farinosa]
MRFNIFATLVVAAFVASCSSFVSAEIAALNGYTYDDKEVVRHLREDSDVQEERFPILEKLKSPFKPKAAAIPAEVTKFKDLSQYMGKGTEDRLKKAGLNAELLQKGDKAQVEKLVELFAKGAKNEKAFWLKMLGWVAASIGVASFIFVLITIIKGGSKGPPSTAAVGTTTPGGA